MKILIATPLMPPSIGGPATYTTLLQKELPPRGIEVDVVSFDEYKHLPKGISHLSFFWKVFRVARHVDLVYGQDPLSTGLPALFAARLARRPFLLKIVGDYAWEQAVVRFGVTETLDEFVVRRHRSLRINFFKWLEYFVALGAVRIVVPSQYLKNIVSSWGVTPEKINVIYNSFTAPNIGADLEKQRRSQIIFSAGRLVSWKGFDTLIKTLPHLPTEARVVIAGDGPELQNLQKLAIQENVSDRVEFLGKLDHEKLLQQLASARLFILASSYEGLSHQLLEALAVGVPVVATNCGGNPEVITHRFDGLLVSYGDVELLAEAIRELWSRPDLAAEYAEHGTEALKKFSQDNMLPSLTTLLNELV